MPPSKDRLIDDSVSPTSTIFSTAKSSTSTCVSHASTQTRGSPSSQGSGKAVSKLVRKKNTNRKGYSIGATSGGIRKNLYGPNMMVTPPKKPHSPQDFSDDERCQYCDRVGSACLNQRFGRFCVAVVYRYYHNNKHKTIDEEVAIQRFKDGYKMAYDRDLFKKHSSLTKSEEIVLPGCLECRSLMFSLNMITWEMMIDDAQKAAGYFDSKKK